MLKATGHCDGIAKKVEFDTLNYFILFSFKNENIVLKINKNKDSCPLIGQQFINCSIQMHNYFTATVTCFIVSITLPSFSGISWTSS